MIDSNDADEKMPVRSTRIARVTNLGLVFTLAFFARLLPVLRGGGLHYYGRYDDGVYYAASASLSFGQVPYRDFVLLHPPGSTIALMPFTLLGRLTSDATGMTAARLAFMTLGSLSAVLVAVIASRWGWGRGTISGLLYAGSAAAVYSEQATFLEPLGTFLTLLAVLALERRHSRHFVWLEIGAGVALGLACSVKIWYAAIFGAVVIVVLLRKEIASAARVALSGVAATSLITLPFFFLAPSQMWTMVVKDQFGREGSSKGRMSRIPSILGTKSTLADFSPAVVHIVTAGFVAVIVTALLFCILDRRAWLISGLFIASALVLIASPSYFRHYGVLLASPIALVLPVGIGKAVSRRASQRFAAFIGMMGTAFVLFSVVAVALSSTGEKFPTARFVAAAPTGCMAADDPAALIQMNRLSQGLRSHCDVPVDVTGASYGSAVPRAENRAFRAWLLDHLTSAAAFTVLRLNRDKLSEVEKQELRAHPVVASGASLNLRLGDGS